MSEPRTLGTLIVVVGKARNLPNKSRFGKQDPYCAIQIGEEKRKTKPIKRGGQHPEWDEELRFRIFEDVDDMLSASQQKPLPGAPGVVTPASMASKARKGQPKKAGKTMRVSVFADDPKEPELISEVLVPIDDVLVKGELDEWYDLKSKDKYSGEIYLELTFYSNAAPPKPKPPMQGSPMANNSPHRPGGRPGLPTSGSVSGMNLYIPPYQSGAAGAAGAAAPAPQRPPVPPAPNSFAELGLPHQQQPQHAHVAQQPNTADALAGQMGSMSLGPAHHRPGAQPVHGATIGHSRPGSYAGPTTQYQQQPGSDGAVAGAAPWASLMQGAQHQQQHGLPRPVSSQDMSSWNHQSLDGRTSAPPRPLTSQTQHHGRTNSLNGGLPVPPGGYPATYQETQPQGYQSPPPAQGYQSPPPAQGYASPPPTLSAQGSFGQAGASQQGSFSQQTPYTPPQPPRQGSWPNQQQQPYQQQQQPYTPPVPPPAPTLSGSLPNTPSHMPAQSGYQNGAYGSPSAGSLYAHRPSLGNQTPLPTPPSNLPPPPTIPPPSHTPQPQQAPPHHHQSPPPSTDTGNYVPWYMQTQQNSAQPPHGGGYGAPAPAPPPPPHRPSVGYYPSDELYAQGGQQQQHQAPPPQQSYGGYQSPPPAAPTPAPMGGYQPQDQYQSHDQYQAPGGYQAPHQAQGYTSPPPQQSGGYYGGAGAPGPVPPPLPPRVPSPMPGTSPTASNTDWRSYLNSLSHVSGTPGATAAANAPTHQQHGAPPAQNDWYGAAGPPPSVPPSLYSQPPQQQW